MFGAAILDVTQEDEVERLVGTAMERFRQPLDIVGVQPMLGFQVTRDAATARARRL